MGFPQLPIVKAKTRSYPAQHLLMVRPDAFGFNPETAASNLFQNEKASLNAAEKAKTEFDGMVAKLQQHGVKVSVLQDSPQPVKPDAVFPNNWFSTHSTGELMLYPMEAPNRRLERRPEALLSLLQGKHTLIDLTGHENENRFLEGTGALVFDHDQKQVFACHSSRMDAGLAGEVARRLKMKLHLFTAGDQQNHPVYHTNVLLAIGKTWAVVCAEAIRDPKEKEQVLQALGLGNKEVMEISIDQMNQFCGNMLAVQNVQGESLILCSESAKNAFRADQIDFLNRHGRLLYFAIPTIETIGGGSVRCMCAEIF